MSTDVLLNLPHLLGLNRAGNCTFFSCNEKVTFSQLSGIVTVFGFKFIDELKRQQSD